MAGWVNVNTSPAPGHPGPRSLISTITKIPILSSTPLTIPCYTLHDSSPVSGHRNLIWRIFQHCTGGAGRGGAVVKDVNTEGSIVTSHEQHCGTGDSSSSQLATESIPTISPSPPWSWAPERQSRVCEPRVNTRKLCCKTVVAVLLWEQRCWAVLGALGSKHGAKH